MFCDVVQQKLGPRVVVFSTVTWIFREGEMLMRNPRMKTEAFRSHFRSWGQGQSQHLSPSRLSPHSYHMPSHSRGKPAHLWLGHWRKDTVILCELSLSLEGKLLFAVGYKCSHEEVVQMVTRNE